MHIDSIFPPPSNLHHYVKSDTALQSEPAGFPDKSENKRGPRVEMGNATQQLGANWRSIHYSLLLGKLGLGLGMRGSYLIGGPRGSVFSGQRRSTLWSHKDLHRNPEIANKKRDFWVAWGVKQEFAEQFARSTQQIWLVPWTHKEGQWKKYIHISPKHYVLHWNSMIPLIFNCRMSMFRAPRQTQRQKTLIKESKYARV